MKYYCKMEDRIIEREELLSRYGSFTPIPELCIFELSIQPDYVPVAFKEVSPGVYYPVRDYTDLRDAAIQALIDSGLTQAEAEAALQ